MTIEQGATEAAVEIRSPRQASIWFVGGGFFVASAFFNLASGQFWIDLVVGALLVAEALWVRGFGVDLTADTANIRGFRRQSVPWAQVQAVLHHQQLGMRRVRLLLDSGKPATLRAPTTWLGFGAAEYERDFERIGHWWLAHRGTDWHPVRPEAPTMPVQD